jgi:hypothetical protein
VVPRGNPGYYSDVLDLDTVFRHIETRPPHADGISMVKFGCDQRAADYLGADNRADPRRVLQMFEDGWTIALNNMQRQLPALAGLCQAAEAVFSAPFQTNLYLTPPNAQGFKAHWDTHDVFVMQVHGAKSWSIYDTKIELPLPGQSFNIQQQDPGPVSDAFMLEAGDLLYIPRGVMHAAHSDAQASLHITFGLMGRTWSELLIEAVASAALANPALRRNLPAGYARGDHDQAATQAMFAGLMADLAGSIDFPAVLGQFRDQFIGGRVASVPGQARQIAGLSALGAQSRVMARPNPIFSIESDGEVVTLNFGANTLTLPDFTYPTIAAALAGEPAVIADLPGPLDDDGKVTLLRRLIREGLVVALDP